MPNPKEILSTLRRAVKSGEDLPPTLALWAIDFGERYYGAAERLHNAIGLDGEAAARAASIAVARFEDLGHAYEDPERHKFPASEYVKDRTEALEEHIGAMTLVLRDIIEDDLHGSPERVEEWKEQRLEIAKALVQESTSILGRQDLQNEVRDSCQLCSDIGVFEPRGCPGCYRGMSLPSDRLGFPFEMARLAPKILPPELMGELTHLEKDAVAAGFWACAQRSSQAFHPVLTAIWDEWAVTICQPKGADTQAQALSPESDGTLQDALAEREKAVWPEFRAMRDENQEHYLVCRMNSPGLMASLDNIDQVICVVKARSSSDAHMRHAYRAAEAFAGLLNALPGLIRINDFHGQVLDPSSWLISGDSESGDE